jgi:hypothetical protein
MAVSQSDLDRLHALEGSVPDNGSSLACLQTGAEVVAFLIAQTRAEPDGADECDVAELLVRSVGLKPDDVRKLERQLRPLGYVAVSDRLKALAGRRKHALRPLGSSGGDAAIPQTSDVSD